MPTQESPAGQAADGDSVAFLAACANQVEQALATLVPEETVPPARLHRAMRYSLFAGGKRLRPALVRASYLLARQGAPDHEAERRCTSAMAAVELLHTYTLVHDDLPAMDDDDLRRGRPTCHKAFDEATAILVGDALQCLAFEVIADLDAEAVRVLARASGSLGVVGGQQEDLDATAMAPAVPGLHNPDSDLGTRLERMHLGKTASLIRASCILGARAARAPEPVIAALGAFGQAIGLAFQVADDVLDATASTATLGKTAGKDAAQHKLTYVSVYGLDTARLTLQRLEQEALSLLPISPGSGALAALARFMVRRDR